MLVVSHALAGNMITFLILATMLVILHSVSNDMRSSLGRMSLAFQVEQKPYTPEKPKPKGKGKDKFRDLFAVVKWSGIGMVAGSGKIQGTVLLNNNVVRVWHKTKTVRDTATNLVKGIFSGISSGFRLLTAAQVLAWNNAAVNFLRKNALAEVKTLTGSQAFQRVNNIKASLGLAQVLTPPGVGNQDPIIAVAGAGDVSAQSVEITIGTFAGATVLGANQYAKVYATPQFGVSKSRFSKSDYRFIGFYAPASSINPLVVSADYIAAFGAVTLNQRIGFAVQFVFDNGTNFVEGGKIYGDLVTVA